MCNDSYSESGAPIAPARCAEYGKLKAENEVLREQAGEDAAVICRLKLIIAQERAVLAPILAHANAHEYAPPIKFSVAACKAMLEAINVPD
jgi:hypothetical protein